MKLLEKGMEMMDAINTNIDRLWEGNELEEAYDCILLEAAGPDSPGAAKEIDEFETELLKTTPLSLVLDGIKEMREKLKTVNHVFFTEKDTEEGPEDFIYELPRCFYVGKYDYYQDYAVREIKEGGEVVGYGMTEGCWGEEFSFKIDNIEVDTIINLYSLVFE